MALPEHDTHYSRRHLPTQTKLQFAEVDKHKSITSDGIHSYHPMVRSDWPQFVTIFLRPFVDEKRYIITKKHPPCI